MNINNKIVLKGLIAIEGIDGSGTTTLKNGLSKQLSEKGMSFQTGFEPTDGPIGQCIRNALSNKSPAFPQTMALLFAADRMEHLYGPQGIAETIDKGQLYISDRYIFSSLAYQSLDNPLEWVELINHQYPLPQILIYLYLPVEVAMKRMEGRSNKEIYETTEFQKRVQTAYRKVIDRYKKSGMAIMEIDASHSAQKILEQALGFILNQGQNADNLV